MIDIARRSNVDLAEQIVLKAYKLPLYSTKEMKEKQIMEFSNNAYLECVDSIAKGD